MDWGALLPLKWLVERALALGISEQLVWLLLSMPVMAALVAVARLLVGLTGFGLMTPIILAVALSFGGWWVLITFGAILAGVYLTRSLMRRLRLRYVSRMASLMSLLSLMLLIFCVVAVALGLPVAATEAAVVFLLLVFAEIYINIQINRSVSASLTMALETLGVAIVIALVVNLPGYRELILAQPELTFVAALILIFLSTRYTGLRLTELWRFRRLISR